MVYFNYLTLAIMLQTNVLYLFTFKPRQPRLTSTALWKQLQPSIKQLIEKIEKKTHMDAKNV